MYCKDCINYYGEGLCRSNRKGYTSALLTADNLACFSPAQTEKKMEQETKICKECGRELPLEQFYKNRWGVTDYCVECMNKKKERKADKAPADLSAIPDGELAAELKRRGWQGVLTRKEEITI